MELTLGAEAAAGTPEAEVKYTMEIALSSSQLADVVAGKPVTVDRICFSADGNKVDTDDYRIVILYRVAAFASRTAPRLVQRVLTSLAGELLLRKPATIKTLATAGPQELCSWYGAIMACGQFAAPSLLMALGTAQCVLEELLGIESTDDKEEEEGSDTNLNKASACAGAGTQAAACAGTDTTTTL